MKAEIFLEVLSEYTHLEIHVSVYVVPRAGFKALQEFSSVSMFQITLCD